MRQTFREFGFVGATGDKNVGIDIIFDAESGARKFRAHCGQSGSTIFNFQSGRFICIISHLDIPLFVSPVKEEIRMENFTNLTRGLKFKNI